MPTEQNIVYVALELYSMVSLTSTYLLIFELLNAKLR